MRKPPASSSFAAWLAAAALAAVCGGVVWIVRTPDGPLRESLRRWQFWSLETVFVLLLSLTAANLPALIRALGLKRRDLRLPAAASFLALVLAGIVAPRTNRIYYDEHIYQAVGQNLTDLRIAQMCNDGNVEYGTLQCSRGEYNKEPYGYPHLLSLAYRLTGVHERTAFVMNVLATPVLVWVVFALTTALTGSVPAGGYAALVASLIPEQLRWGHTAAAEPSAALACAFAVLAAVAFVRLRSTSALMWAAVAGVFAVQFRPECALVAAVIVLVIGVYAPEEFRRARIWAAAALALALLAVHVGHLTAVRNEAWGSPGPKFSLAYASANLSSNGWFYLADPRFPPVYAVLALLAVFSRRTGRAVFVGVVYFLLFWGVFLAFYAGGYNYGADDRFSLMTYPPLAVVAGIGLAGIAERVNSLVQAGLPTRQVLVAMVCFQFLWYMPFVRSIGEEAWGARADVESARSFAHDLPRNSYVLTHNPGMFHLWGISAGQASIAIAEPAYVETVIAPRYAGGVYFHWNFWCNVADPLQQSFCTSVLKQFPHTLVREYRERNYRYGLYRLDVSSADSAAVR